MKHLNKKAIKEGMLLYAVTDRTWLNGRRLEDVVLESLEGGITFLQLREKNLDQETFQKEAETLKLISNKFGVPFVINDNIEIAKAIDADGVHIGQDDINLKEARTILGPDKIIGVSTETVALALKAQEEGADYLGVGAMFSTSTKKDADVTTMETLKAICQAVDIPVVAIGGIHEENISEFENSGIDGIAVVSAIYAEDDIKGATKKLLDKVRKVVN